MIHQNFNLALVSLVLLIIVVFLEEKAEFETTATEALDASESFTDPIIIWFFFLYFHHDSIVMTDDKVLHCFLEQVHFKEVGPHDCLHVLALARRLELLVVHLYDFCFFLHKPYLLI